MRLPDGRRLGYAEYGDPNGRPLFWFHGFPDSRFEASFSHEAALARGIRVLSWDRPGYGISDFAKGRQILDWPDDVAAAADALGIDRFAVVGLSGGCPYASACAYKIPDRLTGVAIVSGLGPTDVKESIRHYNRATRWGFPWYGRLPLLARIGMWWVSLGRFRAEQNFDRLIKRLPPADRAILNRPGVKERGIQTFKEAFRQGSRGSAHDLVLYARPWGFRPEDVSTKVHLWHGEADTIVPVGMGRYEAGAFRDCHSTFVSDAGHFMVVDLIGDILDRLFAPTSA
ncbi:MAG: alpha/beta hydrolase [Dehalococcoidia bacterium]